jgi:hypothetical protein
MDTQLQALRRRLVQACNGQQQQAVQGEQATSVPQAMGPAVSVLFDLLVALRPAELLQAAQQPQPPPVAAATAANNGSSAGRASRNSSSSSTPAAVAKRQGPCQGRAWAKQLLAEGADLLLKGAEELSWQDALQEGAGTGG